MKRTPRILLIGLLAGVAGAALVGCKSLDKPASASFASVRVQGFSREQIRAATMVVFAQDGYTVVKLEGSELAFEKEGSRWDRIAYGNWMDNDAVWVRVNVSVLPLSDGVFLLQCQAFKVRDKGDRVFEEQVRMKNNHSKPYQALLDKVPGQLKR